RELNAARHSTIKANNLFSKRFNFSVNAVTSFFTAEEIEIVTDLDFEKVFYDKWAVLGCDFSLSGDTWGNVLLTKIDETLYIYPIPIRPKNVADKYKHLSGTFYHDEDKND
ncbi:terminase TerL endonuclease subunit, partial [Klebsiella pneumoniae]